ncbi:MAG: GTPase ObgE [Aquificaceae bacterium]|nr:GTPase ObgE [Aquificaceae bacterium]
MFVDKVRIVVKAGDGGNGAIAFLREKYRPFGGPAGGDGGKGGDVILKASSRKTTLYDLKLQGYFKAKRGENGSGKNKAGKSAEDLIIQVPVGTIVIDDIKKEQLADLDKDGASVLVAKGGKGGKGNARFATSTNRAPRFAQKGEKGELRVLILELKSIAHVGLVGVPNAGKSSLLKALTNANPEIAPYPFSTKEPNLGTLLGESIKITIADIPGLIEGADKGKGLGHKFLRHIERCKILLHVIDFSHGEPKRALSELKLIRDQMAAYKKELLEKPHFVVLNKIDLIQNKNQIKEAIDYFEIKTFAVSCLTLEGIDKLKRELIKFFEEDGSKHLL